MANGKVFIKGSIGARGLSMTKWNPDYEKPELWVLGSAGDSFAEFNCGGVAVICGINAKSPNNVTGYRPCVGMVGGTIFYRGKTDDSYSRVNARLDAPTDMQWQWLTDNMPEYLAKISRDDLSDSLLIRDEWYVFNAISPQEKALVSAAPMSMTEFRNKHWNHAFGGGDPLRDLAPELDRSHISTVPTGSMRRKKPFWLNRESAAPCTYYCPVHIPTVDRLHLIREGRIDEAYKMLLEYSPLPASVCGAVCPNLCMENCSRQGVDDPIEVQVLGRAVAGAKSPEVAPSLGKKVAIIGGGPAGMNAAWQLAHAGIDAHIFEKDSFIGGKLAQVIPWERLSKVTWDLEVKRFLETPNIHTTLNVDMNKHVFAKLQGDFDYVIIAVGTHKPRTIPFPGHEMVIPALDFLKKAKGPAPDTVGKEVVVIGGGNVGCDVACEAYRLGAKKVTLVDIQKPLAFGKEKEAAEALGSTFRWPVMTKEVTSQGLIMDTGEMIPAQTVIISIGDVPKLDFLPDSVETLTIGGAAWLKTDEAHLTSDTTVFAIGDVEKPGLATNALGAGKTAAEFIIAKIKNEVWKPFTKKVITQNALTITHYTPDIDHDHSQGDSADRCLSCASCRDCHLCETICPEGAITRQEIEYAHTNGYESGLGASYEYVSDDNKCIACGFCADTCPCGIWTLKDF